MKLPGFEKYLPNVFMILLFEDGRKQGLGLWLVIMSFTLFIFHINGFDLIHLEAGVALGAGIFTGGNLYDKRNERLKMKIVKEPDRSDAPPAPPQA